MGDAKRIEREATAMNLEWHTNTPQKAGFYWFSEGNTLGRTSIIKVWFDPQHLAPKGVDCDSLQRYDNVAGLRGKWYGPLQPPAPYPNI